MYYSKSLECLLHCYMYFQAFTFVNGEDVLMENIYKIKTLLNLIKEVFGVTIMQIIDVLYSNPPIYKKVKEECIGGTCDFIESISLTDFLVQLDSLQEGVD